MTAKAQDTTRSVCRCDIPPATERHDPGFEEAGRLFKALGDETRLAIIKQLREQGEVCACNFMACCVLAQPTLSYHLKVLREAGVVRAVKRGLWVYYTLDEDKMSLLREWLG